LISRQKELATRRVWERAKDKYPGKGLGAREIPPEEIESVVHRIADEEVDTLFAPMVTAIGEVALYGSEAAYNACKTLLDIYPASDLEELDRAVRDLIAVFRKELGIPAVA
jgi:hypothetical protein